MHQKMATTLDRVVDDIQRIWGDARQGGVVRRPQWPMIVLRTPKGWTCPREIDGKLCEGYWRSHQVSMSDMDKPEHIRILEQWKKSYQPEELFDATGRLKAEFTDLTQLGARAAYFKQAIRDKLIEHREYICRHGKDMPEITAWRWGEFEDDGGRASSTEADNG